MTNVTTILRNAGLDFTVAVKPVLVNHPVQGLVEVPEQYAVYREDTHDVFGIVSGKYRPISPIQALQPLDRITEALGMECDKAWAVNKGQKIVVEARFPHDIVIRANGNTDVLHPKMYITTGNDGEHALKLLFGCYLLVCSNGLILPVAGLAHTVKIIHWGTPGDLIDDAIQNIAMIGACLTGATNLFQMMAGCAFDDNSMWKYTMASLDYKRDEDTKDLTPGQYLHALEGQRYTAFDDIKYRWEHCDGMQPFKNTLWGAYNAITGHADHGRRVRNQAANQYAAIDGHIANLKTDAFALAVACTQDGQMLDAVVEDPSLRKRYIDKGKAHFNTMYMGGVN